LQQTEDVSKPVKEMKQLENTIILLENYQHIMNENVAGHGPQVTPAKSTIILLDNYEHILNNSKATASTSAPVQDSDWKVEHPRCYPENTIILMDNYKELMEAM
jgi:hypothetical protein